MVAAAEDVLCEMQQPRGLADAAPRDGKHLVEDVGVAVVQADAGREGQLWGKRGGWSAIGIGGGCSGGSR